MLVSPTEGSPAIYIYSPTVNCVVIFDPALDNACVHVTPALEAAVLMAALAASSATISYQPLPTLFNKILYCHLNEFLLTILVSHK